MVAAVAASSDRTSALRSSGLSRAIPNQRVVQSVIGQDWPRSALNA
jgi:hypothetical protein